MKKAFFLLTFITTLLVGFTSCGGDKTTTNETTEQTKDDGHTCDHSKCALDSTGKCDPSKCDTTTCKKSCCKKKCEHLHDDEEGEHKCGEGNCGEGHKCGH
jgi:hypothetical protein